MREESQKKTITRKRERKKERKKERKQERKWKVSKRFVKKRGAEDIKKNKVRKKRKKQKGRGK